MFIPISGYKSKAPGANNLRGEWQASLNFYFAGLHAKERKQGSKSEPAAAFQR
jgi:hypothetical protein